MLWPVGLVLEVDGSCVQSFHELYYPCTPQKILVNLFPSIIHCYSRFETKQNEIRMTKMSLHIPAEMLEEELQRRKWCDGRVV